jgi:hypothetical protein
MTTKWIKTNQQDLSGSDDIISKKGDTGSSHINYVENYKNIELFENIHGDPSDPIVEGMTVNGCPVTTSNTKSLINQYLHKMKLTITLILSYITSPVDTIDYWLFYICNNICELFDETTHNSGSIIFTDGKPSIKQKWYKYQKREIHVGTTNKTDLKSSTAAEVVKKQMNYIVYLPIVAFITYNWFYLMFYHDVTGEKAYEYVNLKDMFYNKMGGPICMFFLFVVGAMSIVHRALFDWIGPAIDSRMKDFPYLIFFILFYLVYLTYNQHYDYFKKIALKFYNSDFVDTKSVSTVLLVNMLIAFSYFGHYFGYSLTNLKEIPSEFMRLLNMALIPVWIILVIIIVRAFLSHMMYNIAGLLIIIMLFCCSFLGMWWYSYDGNIPRAMNDIDIYIYQAIYNIYDDNSCNFDNAVANETVIGKIFNSNTLKHSVQYMLKLFYMAFYEIICVFIMFHSISVFRKQLSGSLMYFMISIFSAAIIVCGVSFLFKLKYTLPELDSMYIVGKVGSE